MRIQDLQHQPVQTQPKKIGTEYGGWFLHTQLIQPSSIVYSFGIGEDISFDLGLTKETHATVQTFDSTLKLFDWTNEIIEITFLDMNSDAYQSATWSQAVA